MEITGKIIEVLPLKCGTSTKGEWQSQQYVLETIEQYPHKFLFEVFGADKISSFAIQIGEQVTISYNTDARLYKDSMVQTMHGKWFVLLPLLQLLHLHKKTQKLLRSKWAEFHQ